MKRYVIFFLLLIVFMLTTIRVLDEINNKYVSVGIRYEDVLAISEAELKPIDIVVAEFRALGVTTLTVAVEYLTDVADFGLNIIPIVRDEPAVNGDFSYVFFEEGIKEDWAALYGVSLVEFFTTAAPQDFAYARLYTDETVPHISTPDRVDRYLLALTERTNTIFIFTLDEFGIAALRNDILLFIRSATADGYFVSATIPKRINAIFITNNLLLYTLQAAALILAIVFPVASICKFAYYPVDSALICFLKITATTTIGAIVISSILGFANFRLGINLFRGVKAAHVIPLILVAIVMFPKGDDLTAVFSRQKWWLLLLGAAAGAFILYIFIVRTGNSQITNIEQVLRQWLNDLFGVRPRTKEFLIGHPLLILGLYDRRLKYPCVVVGTIGQVSIINTFMHLHTPFIVSFVRTTIGIFLGLVIGIILILIFRVMNQWIKKYE